MLKDDYIWNPWALFKRYHPPREMLSLFLLAIAAEDQEKADMAKEFEQTDTWLRLGKMKRWQFYRALEGTGQDA